MKVSDEADAAPPQALHDGRLVRTLCKLVQAEKTGLEVGKCTYRITDAWFQDTCADAGACHALTADDCHTPDPCRIPTCDPIDGCGSAPLAEGTPCGTGGVCTQGKCVK